jgi:hypothetical protein
MKKRRRLVLIKPAEHEKGKRLTDEVYGATKVLIRNIRSELGSNYREAVIHYAPTKCAMQTAFIAAGVLDCHMPDVSEALRRRADPNQLLVQLTNFLYLSSKSSLQVVIIPFDIDQSRFEELLKMLHDELRWEIDAEKSVLRDRSLIVEYVKA